MESPAPRTTEWHVAERFRGYRLDRFLLEQIPSLSRSRIQKMIGDRIRVSWLPDRERPDASTKVRVGGKVYADHPVLHETPQELHFPVLFEDEELLAIFKPAGVTVHPTNRQRVNTLIEAIRRERNEVALTLTHRLDRETSGVLLLARSSHAARACGKAFMARALHKTYLAKVKGEPSEPSGTIDQWIGKAEKSRVVVRREVVQGENGERAITHFRVLAKNRGFSILELKPVTGRRHQLRVHCEWMKCPIVGDPLYGEPDQTYLDLVEGKRGTPQLHLHAWKLEGTIGEKRISIEAPMDWKKWL